MNQLLRSARARALALLASAALALLTGPGCRTPAPPLPPSQPAAFRTGKLEEIDRTVARHIAAGALPGAVVWIDHRGVHWSKAYGNRALEPATEAMTEDTVFDAASLTKVIATAPAILCLIEDGALNLDEPVARRLPAFGAHGKETITVRHLLTHTSGLRPDLSLEPRWSGYAKAIELACDERPTQAPGIEFVYSDINFIVLGELVRVCSGRRLDQFAAARVFRPLGMTQTTFLPLAAGIPLERIAPTECPTNAACWRGVVHDPTARRMDGVAGHAGLFTTAADLSRFARMMLGGGEFRGRRVFRAQTVQLMTSLQSPPGLPARGLGWDIDSPYAGPRGRHFPVGSYGHTGWTGTSIWMDPGSDTAVILLSNRNHPSEAGDVRALRREIGTLAAEALKDVTWPEPVARTPVPTNAAPRLAGRATNEVLQGIDVLERDDYQALRGLRIGLVTNHTGHDRHRAPTIDLLQAAPGVRLVALFSPEHGIRGQLDEKVGDGRDERTGLPVFSLYGERRAPAPEQMAGLDALVFDIQDIGCRFYTYISTLGNCLEAAAREHKRFIVLDRVNPVNGDTVEGPVFSGVRSFVAWHEIPLRHGMTAGELARLFNEDRGIHADLTVIPCEGWHRGDWFDATGLPWTNPSPNMRSLAEATLYPGVGMLEYCAVSVGRGTATPFEVMGAPYVEEQEFCRQMNAAGLAGVSFLPIRFTPNASKFQGKECGGVRMTLTDRARFRAADLGVSLASTLHRLYAKELKLEAMQPLLGDEETLAAIRAGRPLGDIAAVRDRALGPFVSHRAAYLLYKGGY